MKKILLITSALAFVMLGTAYAGVTDSGITYNVFGKIRTFVDHDYVNSATPTAEARITTDISKVGVSAQAPITFGSQPWVVNAKYVTTIITDNPKRKATQIGDRHSTIGIASNADSSKALLAVDIGRQEHALYNAYKWYGLYGDLYGSPIGEIHNRQGLRVSNGIFVKSSPINGLTLNFDYGLSEVNNKTGSYSTGAKYSFGDYRIFAFYYDNLDQNKSTLVGGSVYFDSISTLVSAMASHDETAIESANGYTVFATYHATNRWDIIPGFGYKTTGVYAYTMGADYKLSKNVKLQLRGQRVLSNNVINFTTANDYAGALGTQRTQIGAGLKFVF